MEQGDATPSLIDEALFRPVRTGNAFEDTFARLLQAIRLGAVGPGESLPAERDLAQRFAVSRDTVRDALKELAAAGYIVSRRGRYGGTFVADVLAVEVIDWHDDGRIPRVRRLGFGPLDDRWIEVGPLGDCCLRVRRAGRWISPPHLRQSAWPRNTSLWLPRGWFCSAGIAQRGR